MRGAIVIAVITGALALPVAAAAFNPKQIELKDPSGDDKGPGTYEYPTDPIYTRGSFDLKRVSITDKGADLEVVVELNAKLEDPWNSRSWGGNGFSLQMVQLYLDTKKGGFRGALPGMNVKFVKGQAWDKVVFISPQPKNKIVAEMKAKAGKKTRGLVVPRQVVVRGRAIVAIVAKADLGTPQRSWGFQALVQSNEGYPTANSVFARQVNEYPGQHRFGGGNDHDCDPHVIDALAGKATGAAAEAKAQYDALRVYTCDAAGKGHKAELPMVYPGR